MNLLKIWIGNLRARFVVPLNESVHIKSRHIDLDLIIVYYHDTLYADIGAIWILEIYLYPETSRVCVWLAVNLSFYNRVHISFPLI